MVAAGALFLTVLVFGSFHQTHWFGSAMLVQFRPCLASARTILERLLAASLFALLESIFQFTLTTFGPKAPEATTQPLCITPEQEPPGTLCFCGSGFTQTDMFLQRVALTALRCSLSV